jgi:hypothetical protein
MAPDQRPPEKLLRQLDRCRELTDQIPITDANATHLGIQVAVNAQWNLRGTMRHLLNLHQEAQRAFRTKHDDQLRSELSKRQTKRNDSRTEVRPVLETRSG